jgi:hypothetical protein
METLLSHPTESSAKNSDAEERFNWPLCYEAEEFIHAKLARLTASNSFARSLAERMRHETGTLLLDWVDHLFLPANEESRLLELGYSEDTRATAESPRVLWHPEAMLPQVVLGGEHSFAVALKVENIAQFLAVHGITTPVEGSPLSRYRHAMVAEENGARLSVVERRGYHGFCTGKVDAATMLEAREQWQTRRRVFTDDAAGFQQTQKLLEDLVERIGRNQACHVVFDVEREFWQRRNRAGQIQKARQDALGLGWANHDHHTFRSSRRHFVDLMRALETLGFKRRERYYTGAQAGWGAQILEQSVEGIVAFCDVDLEPEETEIDFSRHELPESKRLGTIGLWVGLHGESFLDAGMHHLECRFDHALLREQFAALNVNTMAPFSDFPFLKQAFTEGERWPVNPRRLEALRASGAISQEQFAQFQKEGAIGSHLENLQRKGGFKGFNQKSVSVIIKATDPRLQDG